MANARKWSSLIIAAVLYYIVHEGAHWIVSMILGTFESVRIAGWGLGVQVVATTDDETSESHLFSPHMKTKEEL